MRPQARVRGLEEVGILKGRSPDSCQAGRLGSAPMRGHTPGLRADGERLAGKSELTVEFRKGK